MAGDQYQNLKDNSKHKIYFNGVKNFGKDKNYLVFIRESDGKEVDIPLNDREIRHILMYTEKLAYPTKPPIERGNDEESDL